MKGVTFLRKKYRSVTRRWLPWVYHKSTQRQNISLRNKLGHQRLRLSADKSTYIFLAHDAGLSFHLITLCLIAKTMQTLGHQVLMVSCQGNLRRCTVKDCSHLPIETPKSQEKRFCNECQNHALTSFDKYNLPYIQLSELLTPDYDKAEIALYNFKAAIETFNYDHVPFGQLALGETIRNCKLSTHRLSTEYLKQYTRQHSQAIMAFYFAIKQLMGQYKVARVIYFGDYGTVLGVLKACMQSKIPVTNVSHALITNVQRMKIPMMNALSTADQFWRLEQWESWKYIPLKPAQVDSIAKDVLFRISGAGFTIFSPKKTDDSHKIFDQLKLSKTRKLVVAYTSSLDEVLTTQVQYSALGVQPLDSSGPFNSQVEWLEKCSEFVENSQDLQLVIRIHPRELASGVGSNESEHLSLLRSALAKSYRHVKVVWPEDNLSSYDLGELADCIAIAWTSIGLELSRLGAPVIAAFQYCPYPKDFVEFELDIGDYFEKLRQLAFAPSSFDKIQASFRWFYIARMSHAVDVSDIDPASDFTTLPEFKMPGCSREIEQVMLGQKHMSSLNMDKQKIHVVEDETEALLGQIQWMITVLSGLPVQHPIDLYYDDAKIGESKQDVPGVQILGESQSNWIRIKQNNQAKRKYSPMIARLIRVLCSQHQQLANSESMYEIL